MMYYKYFRKKMFAILNMFMILKDKVTSALVPVLILNTYKNTTAV